ncbi:MAG: carbon monoxide dehydrogenase subunit G [Betaproteobacteria bacterium]|nr:carbon monoxide dehydrogenase subunit G [Betaproteobacteria bacterium]
MELTSSYTLPIARETVWQALNDPAALKACIAGCEKFERVSDHEFAATVMASIGPVKARFSGKVLLAEVDAPHGYTLNFEGQGGAAGFGKGSARVELVSEGGSTRLTYRAKAQVGGKLAQVGSRLIDGAAKKMADDFFEKFVAQLGGSKAAPVEAAAHAAPAGDTVIHPALIALALAGVVAVLYVLTHA